MRIGDRRIDESHPPYVIAELGVNHNGSVSKAMELVHIAKHVKADAIKLQYFRADVLMSAASRLASYQAEAGEADPVQMLTRLELDPSEIEQLVDAAHARHLHAMVTVFSVSLVDEMEALGIDAFKVASPDIINRPLIERLRSTGKPMILSTGAAALEEVVAAVSWLGHHPYVLMQCVSAYPTDDVDAALGGRMALHRINPRALGYSDHTTHLDTGALAVAGGACVLEKHLTDDPTAMGPDHGTSLDEAGFAEYVRLAHRAWRMRGRIEKRVLAVEEDVRDVSRQSITATRALPEGHVIARDDITLKRPGVGIAPAQFDDVIGRTLARAVQADYPLTKEDLARMIGAGLRW